MDYLTLRALVKSKVMTVKNHFMTTPMETNYANQDGSVAQTLIDYYTAKAKAGLPVVIIEETAVNQAGQAIPNQLGFWSDEHIAGFKELASNCHKYGAKVCVQLSYSDEAFAIQPVATSSTNGPISMRSSRELTTKEIYEIMQQFVEATRKCRDAGIDAVEIQAAPGGLIGQFLSPRTNRRADEFGGNPENRMRFLLLIIQGIRQQVASTYPLIVRISGEDFTGDLRTTEINALARRLEHAGVTAVLVSSKAGYLHGLIEKIKKSVAIPVIVKFLLVPLSEALHQISQWMSGRMARRIWFH